jgi:predicted dehydrogenase
MRRRHFIKQVSIGALGAGVAPSLALRAGATPASERIRIGVIGTGSRGQWMMRLFLRQPGVEIVGLCDVYDLRFKEGREITGAETPVYRDYREMLEKQPMDAVLIASPLRLHGEHMVAALERDLHVYGEKTMCYSLADSRAVMQAAAASKGIFQIGHQYRYAPWFREAIQRVHQGEIGEVTHVFGYWHRNNNWRRPCPDPSLERLINWRMYLEYSRGLIAELGSHHIDITNWVFGARAQSAIGSGGISVYPDGRETFDNVQVVFRYPGQRTLMFSSLLGNQRVGYQVWIVGTGGNLQLTLQDATFYYEVWKPNSAVPESFKEGHDTGATLATAGDMPYRGSGKPVEKGEGDDANQDFQAALSFCESVRTGTRPFGDQHVGWSSALPVIFGHQAIREARHVEFAGHMEAFPAQAADARTGRNRATGLG